MSIAICASLRPSFCVRVLLAMHALGALVVGVVLLLASQGVDSGAPLGRYAMPVAGAAASLCAGGLFALLFARSVAASRKAARLDISGVGQLRLAVYLDQRRAEDPGVVVRLQAGSTLWPGFMLLRLRDEAGHYSAWPLCAGSVAGNAYRPLSVACRLIAAATGGADK